MKNPKVIVPMNSRHYSRVSKTVAFNRFISGESFFIRPRKQPFPLRWTGSSTPSGKKWLRDAEKYRKSQFQWRGSIEKTAWANMYRNWKYYNSNKFQEGNDYAYYYVKKKKV